MTKNDTTDVSEYPQEPPEFTALIVCTANVCRSPVAEFLLRDAVERRGHHWTIHSAGLAALDGDAIHPYGARLLSQRQVDVAGWSSHSLTRSAIEEASVVLTATRSQAEAVVSIVPSAIMRVFPLRQFARLASSAAPGGDDCVETGLDLLRAADLARTRVATIDPAQDDVRDPIRRTHGFFRRRVAEIESATQDIASRLVALHDTSAPAATS